MLILHTADWHLGNTFHGHSREAEHAHFLSWLLDLLRERQPDALLVTGDIFDSANPPASAESMYYHFLSAATAAVPGIHIIVTSGNHDSGGRLEAPAPLLSTQGITVRGTIRCDEEGTPLYDHYLIPLPPRGAEEPEAVAFAVPFLRGADYDGGLTPEQGLQHFFEALHKRHRKSDLKRLPVIVCAHYYASGADICGEDHSERLVVGGQDQVSADVAGEAAYVALGHIHKAQQVSATAWYAGSALPMSFSEKHYHHGILAVDMEPEGMTRVETIPYEPLRHLITIPEHGAATTAEMLDAISRLPRRGKKDDGETWPYLEIRLHEEKPEPGLIHDVQEMLADKAVRFCRIVRDAVTITNAERKTENIETLQTLTPLDMAQRIFRARYDDDMPQEMTKRLEIAISQQA